MPGAQTSCLRFVKAMTSDLVTERWAVLSDRGVEATGLTHEDARRLVHRLAGEGRHGLCIITDEAASRMAEAAFLSKQRNTQNAV